MKNHYELLSLPPDADADEIKKAFRREIARYHPDKVIHLGAEFQEMAATRAAELTGAYKTLTDPVLRAEYDATIVAKPPALPEVQVEDRPPTGNQSRFASERADRDVILRRAIAARALSTVESLYGKCDTPTVRDFDIAMVPVAKPRFLGAPPPRVLVRVVNFANGDAIMDAFNAAIRARVHAGKSPVVVLLFSRRIAEQQELSKAWDVVARKRKGSDDPEEVIVIPIDVADWSCRVPENSSPAVRRLADQICA